MADALGYATPTRSMAGRRRRGPHDRLDERRRPGTASRSSLAGPGSALARARPRRSAPGVVLRDGEVHLAADADPADDPRSSLRGRGRGRAARHAHRPRRRSTGWRPRRRRCPTRGRPRPATRSSSCCSAGPPAIAVIEALDQQGLWERILPEWEPVRSQPQRNAYHRFTVDRHLCEAAAERRRARRPGRPARPARARRAAARHRQGPARRPHRGRASSWSRAIGARMGFAARRRRRARRRWSATTCCCPTSPPAATSTTPPPSTRVAERRRRRATPSSCSPRSPRPTRWPPARRRGATWKAGLVAELVDRDRPRARRRRRGRRRPATEFPTAEQRALLAAGEHGRSQADGDRAHRGRPRPARACSAGSPACCRCTASTCSPPTPRRPSDGMALEQFRVAVQLRTDRSPGTGSTADLERALGRPARPPGPARRAGPHVRAGAGRRRPRRPSPRCASTTTRRPTRRWSRCTPPTRIGVLYRITRALAELDLDIRTAKVQTLGDQVVDAFYVRDRGRREGHRRRPPAPRSSGPSSTPSTSADAGRVEPVTGLAGSVAGGGAGRSPTDAAATCCAGARRSPASPAPGSASPRACTSGSASRRCSRSPPTSASPPPASALSTPSRRSSTSG